MGNLAEWLPRVGASLIDSVVTGLPLLIGYIVFFVSLASATTDGTLDEADTGAPIVALIFLILGILGTIGLTLWTRVFQQGSTGQSIGKKVLKIKLVDANTGQTIGAGKAFLREICHAADSAICVLGYLWPLWDVKKQTWADKICDTLVVEA